MCVYGAAAQSKWPPEGIFQEPIARMVANQAVEVPIPEPEVAMSIDIVRTVKRDLKMDGPAGRGPGAGRGCDSLK